MYISQYRSRLIFTTSNVLFLLAQSLEYEEIVKDPTGGLKILGLRCDPLFDCIVLSQCKELLVSWFYGKYGQARASPTRSN